MNSQQRKALAGIVEKAYGRRIESQRQQSHDYTERVIREVKVQLGVDKMEHARKEHERSIKELDEAIESAGFSKYGNGLVPGSEAKQLVGQLTEPDKRRLENLHKEMDSLLARIWSAESLEDVKPDIDALLEEEPVPEEILSSVSAK
jgi:hypothetical protein